MPWSVVWCSNEENALGYHDDVGIAKEDLEEGIDLMDTDGEDAEEEEEDSEEERRVAEGFIEDAKFAEEIGLDAEVRRGGSRHILPIHSY